MFLLHKVGPGLSKKKEGALINGEIGVSFLLQIQFFSVEPDVRFENGIF